MASKPSGSFGWCTRAQARGERARPAPRASRASWSTTQRGPSPGNTVTAFVPGANAALTGQRRPTASPPRPRRSRTTSLPGLPCAARSTPPGRPPPTLRMTSCSGPADRGVGPVALAEHVAAACSCRWRRGSGRCTMITGPTGIVVASTPWMLNSSVHGGLDRGEHHRQVLGLAAGHHRVDRRPSRRCTSTRSGGTTATISSGARVVPSSIRSTRSSVGGTTGRPSVQPAVEQRLDLVFERRRARPGGCAAPTPPKRTRSSSTRSGSTRHRAAAGPHDGQVGAEVGDAGDALPRRSRSQPTVRSTSTPSLDADQRRHRLDVVVPADGEVGVVDRRRRRRGTSGRPGCRR